MSKKKKVIIISLSALVGVIALMILLTFTLFAVRHVEVDFKSSTINLTPTSEEIVEHSGIKNGGSVFFQNKNKYIDNLENKYPYIRVVNIETVFPSKLVLHIVERDEVYAVKYQELYYICDYDFKVLKITDNFESDETNAIMLEGIQVEEANYALCDKLKVDNFANIYEKLYENNRVLSEQRSIIKDIEFFMENDGVYQKETLTAKLTLFNGQVYRINNCERGLKGKTKLFEKS